MEDEMIIKLYFDRDENAIKQTDRKYGKYCHSISYGVLRSREDAMECVNDTYLKVWNTIPPQNPKSFSAFIGRIVRNISINRYRHNKAMCRSDDYEAILDEVTDFTPDMQFTESAIERKHLTDTINAFVAGLPYITRVIFVRRYWYMSAVKEIARDYGMGESAVKQQLMRTRNRFKEYLEKEGFNV